MAGPSRQVNLVPAHITPEAIQDPPSEFTAENAEYAELKTNDLFRAFREFRGE